MRAVCFHPQHPALQRRLPRPAVQAEPPVARDDRRHAVGGDARRRARPLAGAARRRARRARALLGGRLCAVDRKLGDEGQPYGMS